jgi:apolipoprotein N-acyltransferase
MIPAYLRPISRNPLRFENKAVWIDDRGRVDHTYLKHYPVPLEPSVVGRAPVQAVKTRWGTLATAICYDFDFPSYARKYGTAKIDLVILPSSENLGMEFLHPRIAAVRAIEGGYSILRPARLGRATGIDPQGRQVGWTSDNAGDEKLLRLSLPVRRKWTLYSQIGDLLVYLAMGFLGAIMLTKFSMKTCSTC